MNEFSISNLDDYKKEVDFCNDNDLLPFIVTFYIDGEYTIDVDILGKFIPTDILDEYDTEYDSFRIPKKYKTKLDFINFIESLGFEYDPADI